MPREMEYSEIAGNWCVLQIPRFEAFIRALGACK
jgi:hypothetical protein